MKIFFRKPKTLCFSFFHSRLTSRLGTHLDRTLSHPYHEPEHTWQTVRTWLPKSHTTSHSLTFRKSRRKPGTWRRLSSEEKRRQKSAFLLFSCRRRRHEVFASSGTLPTGFVNDRQIHLDPRIPALVPEYLSGFRRHHVRNDGEARLPRRAGGGGPVAADVGGIVRHHYVEVIVATW